jgi:chaperonin GroEL (HSP60 family)
MRRQEYRFISLLNPPRTIVENAGLEGSVVVAKALKEKAILV